MLVPDLVTSVTAAPPVRPSAAVNWLVASWNCSRLSRREAHQRSAVVVVPVVGAVDGRHHVRAGGSHEGHGPDVLLGPVEIGDTARPPAAAPASR